MFRFNVKFKTIICCSCASLALLQINAPSSFATDAWALPSGGLVVGGSADFDYSKNNELHINQHSDRAVIDWDSFNIGADALTQFHQNSSHSLAVNRVVGKGTDPTHILGKLKANGRVMVLDRNGVIFGGGTKVDVGSILASTGDVNTDAVMRGDLIDLDGIGGDGYIINNGDINVAEAGLAAFVAPTVINNGVINAKLGRVQIGASERATIDLYGDGLMELALNEGTQQILVNNGVISADGGTVQIQAAAAKDIVNNSIINTGIIAADTVAEKNGKIVLYAEGSNTSDAAKTVEGRSVTHNSGYISTAGYDAGEQGGEVEILGDSVVLADDTIINASGDAGGGNIKIGGDYLGQGDTPSAKQTSLSSGSVILNDAITNGDGGETIIWSDDTTKFHGLVLSRGGEQGGDGGFVETSGKINLDAKGTVDLSAPKGSKGTYLLDPADITIHGNVAPTDFAGLNIWLDASEAASVTESAGAVSQWNDKSGNGNNATQIDVTYQPTYSSDATGGFLTFTGPGNAVQANEYLVFDTPIDGQSVFFVGDVNPAATGFNAVITSNYGTSGEDYIFIVSSTQPYAVSMDGASSGARGNWFLNNEFQAYGTNVGSVSDIPVGAAIHNFIYPDGTAPETDYASIGNLDNVNNTLSYRFGYNGKFREIAVFDNALVSNQIELMNQYHSAKWDVGILPPGTGVTEAAQAMASDGFGEFTVSYLERLSETADLVLQATNSITLDLNGDNLSLDSGRSLSLLTGIGDINIASTGTITTNGGNVTFTSGGTGNINVNNALTLNAIGGGNLDFTSGGVTNNVENVSVINGNRLNDLYIPPVTDSVTIPTSAESVLPTSVTQVNQSAAKDNVILLSDFDYESEDSPSAAADCLVSMNTGLCVVK